jgi:flagellar hook-associated protein 1 FlgK
MSPSLFASLGIARDALAAQQLALDVAQNNIANVNTPGYARQRANFVPGDPIAQEMYQLGAGVRVDSIDSYRSRFLDHRVNEELQRQGEDSASASTLQQVEALFNDTSESGLQSVIAAFFNSFSSLASAPEDVTLRQQVLACAENLGAQFRQKYESLQSVQTLQDRAIEDTVAEINSLAENIASLNVEIVAASGSQSNAGTLRDRRQVLIDQLAELTDIAYFETESGSITVMSRQGATLVVGDRSTSWQVGASTSDTALHVTAGGADITSKIQSGKLGGLLKVRDNRIVGYLSMLDNMAGAIINRVNAQHAQGEDLNGGLGGDFFVPFTSTVPGSNQGAARAMKLAITDPALIAAAGVGAGVGSNANARMLAGIQDEPILSGGQATIDQAYTNLIYSIGRDTKNAVDGLETQNQLLTQLQNQRDAVIGVSLDEEAVSILRFQKAYQANARIISIIDSLTEEMIQLLGG